METSAKLGTKVDDAFVKMTKSIKESVDKRGLAGVGTSSVQLSGTVSLERGDTQMSMSDRCCR